MPEREDDRKTLNSKYEHDVPSCMIQRTLDG